MFIPHSRPTLDSTEVEAIAKTIKSSHIAAGKEVDEFEKEVADYCGSGGGIACSSGTAAIHLALIGLGIGKGMEVIIPSFTCSSLYHAVAYTGASPVLADCDPTTFLLTLKTIKDRITTKTRAIILPHMFGLPAAIDEIKAYGVPIIEDIAQSMGAEYKGSKTGGLTEIAVTSFYATKMMTTGTGGMVLSNDQGLLERIRDMIGPDKKPDLNLRFPYQMNDLQAAMGRSQLKKLDAFIAKREEIALYLNEGLKDLHVELPQKRHESRRVYFRYPLRLKKQADPALQYLNEKGIEAKRPIFCPLHHLQKRYTEKGLDSFPCTEDAWRNTLSLPIYPSLTFDEVDTQILCMREASKIL